MPAKPNSISCAHGQLARSCDRCADAAEIQELRAEIAALRKDAERYRHLRLPDVDLVGCSISYALDELDAAVDASIDLAATGSD